MHEKAPGHNTILYQCFLLPIYLLPSDKLVYTPMRLRTDRPLCVIFGHLSRSDMVTVCSAPSTSPRTPSATTYELQCLGYYSIVYFLLFTFSCFLLLLFNKSRTIHRNALKCYLLWFNALYRGQRNKIPKTWQTIMQIFCSCRKNTEEKKKTIYFNFSIEKKHKTTFRWKSIKILCLRLQGKPNGKWKTLNKQALDHILRCEERSREQYRG